MGGGSKKSGEAFSLIEGSGILVDENRKRPVFDVTSDRVFRCGKSAE